MRLVTRKVFLVQQYKAQQWNAKFHVALINSKYARCITEDGDEYIWTGTLKQLKRLMKENE